MPAKGFGAHVGGREVILNHTLRPAQPARHLMGHTGRSVTGSLLGSDADLQDREKEKACQ